jgi:hypothetical protein
LLYENRGPVSVNPRLKELVHRPGGILSHILEDVGVPSEGHRRVGVAEHPGDRVERNALAQRQGAGGVPQVVEADAYREAGLLQKSPEGTRNGVAPADLAFRVREHQAGVRPIGRRDPLLELPGTVLLEDLDGAGADTDLALLARLGGGDARLRTGVGGVPNGDGGFAGEVDVLPPERCELALAHPGSERECYQGLVSRAHSGP